MKGWYNDKDLLRASLTTQAKSKNYQGYIIMYYGGEIGFLYVQSFKNQNSLLNSSNHKKSSKTI